MELYYTFSVLIVLAALFAYINNRFLKLPTAIGIKLMAILVSVIIRAAGDYIFPGVISRFSRMILKFDFTEALMGEMWKRRLRGITV